MARVLQLIDIDGTPELLALARDVQRSQKPCVLRAAGEAVAVIVPAKAPRRSPARARPVTTDDPLFRLIGIGQSETPGDISEHKDDYSLRAKRAVSR